MIVTNSTRTHSGSVSYGTFVSPRSGYQYQGAVRYVDGIYNIGLSEVVPGHKPRELLAHQIEDCRPERI